MIGQRKCTPTQCGETTRMRNTDTHTHTRARARARDTHATRLARGANETHRKILHILTAPSKCWTMRDEGTPVLSAIGDRPFAHSICRSGGWESPVSCTRDTYKYASTHAAIGSHIRAHTRHYMYEVRGSPRKSVWMVSALILRTYIHILITNTRTHEYLYTCNMYIYIYYQKAK